MIQLSLYAYNTESGQYVIPSQLVTGDTLAEAVRQAKAVLDAAITPPATAAAATANPGPEATPPGEDLLLRKAEEFTRTEVVCLEAWLTAAQQGDAGKARAILRTGLLAEHYRSLLHEDPVQITEPQSTQLRLLLEEFDRALQLVGGPVAPYP